MKKIILSAVLLIASLTLSAQEQKSASSSKGLYTLDKIHWVNPWLGTENMSGMVLNDTIFKDFNAFADASLSAKYEIGELKNIYDPSSTVTGAFNVDSYSRLGKVFLYGKFGYDYSYSTGSRWRGLINPYESPFMMADSIPGNMSLEMYNMEAGIGIPLGKGFSAGLDFSYNVGIMAKHRDLRNKNTYMDFVIAPGFMYTGKKVSGGLSLGYNRNTERIEYKQIDSSTEKYIFSLYGMWLFSSSGFASAETMRRKENSGYFASLQLDVILGKFRLFNSFRADYKDGMQTETGYNNLIHGQIRQLTYSDRLILQYGLNHRLKADVSFYTMLGYKYLQRQELDPDSNVRIWVSYGGPINNYIRNFSSMDIDYTYRRALSMTDIRWESSIGFRHMNIDNTYKEAPIKFLQDLRSYEGYLKFAKYFKNGNSLFDVIPEVSYSWAEGTPDDIINVETGEMLEKNAQWQMLDQLMEEFNFWKASKVSAGLGFKYTYILDPEKGTDIYAKTSYNIRMAVDNGLEKMCRHNALFTIGFTF